jgi:hypothetical protein
MSTKKTTVSKKKEPKSVNSKEEKKETVELKEQPKEQVTEPPKEQASEPPKEQPVVAEGGQPKKNKKTTATSKKQPKKNAKKKSTGKKKPKKTTETKKGGKANKKETKVENKEGSETENSKRRYFKVVVNGEEAHGRFSGTKPKQAANKALTSILKSKEKVGGDSGQTATHGQIKFSIIECTRGSKHKQYNYVGERVKLENPMLVEIGEGDDLKVIEYKFNNRVMKDKTFQA